MMRKLTFIAIVSMLSVLTCRSQVKDFYLYGEVKEAIGKTDLIKAMVLISNKEGTKTDTIRVGGSMYKNGEEFPLASFAIPVERKDSTYVFDVVCEGYTPNTVVFDVRKIGKREEGRKVPTVYLKRAPRMLDEVTVTTSKIKFYNKGDTVVFNADAFQLAEGSMLDALIAQLPGVELNESGQIKVNGEFVETLLLDGKQFLNGDNQLMLENIGAYTVKNIEVYKGQTDEEKWRNDGTEPKHLTMDIKLKKEYNMGWLINAQGGIGTKDRYTGRLFASWFNPTTSIALIGNINNLNDNREPGKNDNWQPEMMPSGTKEYKLGALNYDYQSAERDRMANGKFVFRETRYRNHTTTARTNFLTGGNTYDNSFDTDDSRDTRIDTDHFLSLFKERYRLGMVVKGRYRDRKNSIAGVSAVFDSEQNDITMKALEAMYSDGSPVNLNSVINRSITKTDGSAMNYTVQAFPHFEWKIPRTSDHLLLEVGFSYSGAKEERWKDYVINYGADQNPAYRKRQYFDNTPNHTLRYNHNLTYRFRIGKVMMSLHYEYMFWDKVKDSYMYALDRLADMGVYGTLPADYLDSFDPANSYTSRSLDNQHTLTPTIQYSKSSDKSLFIMTLGPEIGFKHTHFDYMRNGKAYDVRRTDFLFTTGSWDASFDFLFGRKESNGRGRSFRNVIAYNLLVTPKTPDPVDLIDVVNDADPLNIYTGNPHLKTQYTVGHTLKWDYTPTVLKLNNTVKLNFSVTDNALTKGYVYDTATGVRHFKTYNTGGNSNYGLSNTLRYQFGSKDQFTISSITDLNRYNYGDMIGVDLDRPDLSKVGNTSFNEKLTLSWQLGRQMLQLRGGYTNRHTTSTREDFSTIDANHFNAGVTGIFKLPYGFGVSTDFTVYTRRGYGVKELDTSDAIWNMRLTWSPVRNKHWVFMVDGFDMLHQLSNVNYAVSASGRTVSYSNALPRYVLFSVQYRLNIQPKKK